MKKGDYLIIGLNPGGDPIGDHESTILSSLSAFQDEDFNAYLHQDWNNGKKHKLQENLKKIAPALGVKLEDICATNLIYSRSKNEREIKDWKNLPKYLKVFDRILGVVKPKTIISFGKDTYLEIRKHLSKNFEIEDFKDEESGHGN